MTRIFFRFLVLIVALNNTALSYSEDPKVSSTEVAHANTQDFPSSKWDALGNYLATMMTTSSSINHNTIQVTIFGMFRKHIWPTYEGFIQSLLKYSDNRIVVTLIDVQVHEVRTIRYQDFFVLLVYESVNNYDQTFDLYIKSIIRDTATKIFLVLSSDSSILNLKTTWEILCRLEYYNVYAVHHHSSGKILPLRTLIEDNGATIRHANESQFLLIKDTLKPKDIPSTKVIFYNQYPFSYIENKKFIGADGRVIEELSKKIQSDYGIVNDHTDKPNLHEISSLIVYSADINLYSNADIQSKNIARIALIDDIGWCILAPRNIPISALEKFSFPLDKETVLMFLLSTASVVLCWKLITRDLSLPTILMAVYEISFNLGAANIERLSIRENILVYCFIFASFFTVSFYETIFISLMLVEPGLRSAYDLKELNETGAKFYSFYDEKISAFNNLPSINKNLILNVLNLSGSVSFDIPENFDPDLVYSVSCEMANFFVDSPRNYRDGKRLFDIIRITQHYSTYGVRKAYFYVDEFKNLISQLIESGIYKFWKESGHTKTVQNQVIDTGLNAYDMTFPLVIVFTGGVMAFVVFLAEIVYFHYGTQIRKFPKFLELKKKEVPLPAKSRKFNLEKWKKKFIYKKDLHKVLKNVLPPGEHLKLKSDKEVIKCRQSLNGSYLTFKKFKIHRKKSKRIKHKIIQVAPCEPSCSYETRV